MKVSALNLPPWIAESLTADGVTDLRDFHPASPAKLMAITGIGWRGTAAILAAVINNEVEKKENSHNSEQIETMLYAVTFIKNVLPGLCEESLITTQEANDILAGIDVAIDILMEKAGAEYDEFGDPIIVKEFER